MNQGITIKKSNGYITGKIMELKINLR